MARAGGGPATATALGLLADGRVGWDGDGTTVDGTPGYHEMGEGAVPGTGPTIGDDD